MDNTVTVTANEDTITTTVNGDNTVNMYPRTTRAQRREAKRMVKLFNKIQNKEKVKADLCLKYDGENERWIK